MEGIHSFQLETLLMVILIFLMQNIFRMKIMLLQ